jgi:hypothetical protein
MVLDRVWPYKDQMDIVEYMTDECINYYPQELETRADQIIYFALTLSAPKGSYAKLQIVAACNEDAIPSVMKNQGKKLYYMFFKPIYHDEFTPSQLTECKEKILRD